MIKSRDITLWLIIVTLAVVPLVFIPVGNGDFFYLPKVTALRIIALVYMFVVVRYKSKISEIISFDWINRVLLLYFVWLIIATMFSVDIVNSIDGRVLRVEGLSTILLYFIVFLIARHQGTISKSNVFWMLMAGCVIASYGILQSYGIEFFPRDFIRITWVAAISTIGNPNFLGSYLVLLLPFAVHVFVVERKRFGIFIYAVLFYGLLATLTRGTWIGAFFSILMYSGYVFIHRKKFHVRMQDVGLLVLVSLLCLIVFDISNSGSLLVRLLTIPNDIGEVVSGGENLEKAGSYRMFIWLRVIELIKIRPLFGFGLENLHVAFEMHFSEDIVKYLGAPLLIDKAHNEYLHIAVSAGIPALMIYISFIALVIRKGVNKLMDLPYALPLLTSVFGYLIQAFFNISVVSVAYIFWVFLGFIASGIRIEE